MKTDEMAFIQFKERMINAFMALNEATDGSYRVNIEKKIEDARFDLLVIKNDLPAVKSKEYHERYKKIPLKSRIGMNLRYKHPRLFKLIKKR